MTDQPLTERSEGHAAHTQAAGQDGGLPGQFHRPVKITVIGAGSHFTHPLMNDILSMPHAERGEIALVDIDPRRLVPMKQIVERLVQHYNKPGWTVTASTDRHEVLSGTQYLINTIDVGGLDCVRSDNDIALRYGVDQCIGDTIGPGGLFKALRTVPVWLDILRDAEQYCPDALVLNYTNPMSILCLAAGRSSAMSIVGLCHSVQCTCRKLAKDAGIAFDELDFDCAGINHLAWFTRLEHRSCNLYLALYEKVKDHLGDAYESDPVRYDMMLHFGAFITESSGHLSEYLPYYRTRPDTLKHYCRDGYRGESSFYADNWPTWRKQQDEQRDRVLAGDEPLARERSFEYASWIIEAREKNAPFTIYGNVMNNAASANSTANATDAAAGARPGAGALLIDNLPADGCVEVACDVSSAGIVPRRFGKLPPQMAGVCASNMAMFDLAATACIERSKEAAIHALLLDPLTAACCTPEQIKQMTLEMFDAQQAFLAEYK